MGKQLWLRNALVMIGAYYLASWLIIPFWLLISKLTEGRTYQGGWQTLVMHALNTIPVALGAALAGVAAGFCLETARPLAWAAGVGVFVGVCTWSATRWYVTPTLMDLLPQLAKALVAAGVAFAMCWAIERRRKAVEVPSAAA